MTNKLKLVMVGNGMAGVRTLEELIKLTPDLYDITVFGSEPHPNYNRILLSPVLAGEQTLDEIVLNPLAWYAEQGITLHTGKQIAKIDRVKRVVIGEDARGNRTNDDQPVDDLVHLARNHPIRTHRTVAHRRVQQDHRTDDGRPQRFARLACEEQRADADDVFDDLMQPKAATLCTHALATLRHEYRVRT